MTKQQLQQELKAKVKPGVKPSDLRKLKRSKSAGDIPPSSPSPHSVPLTKSQSNPPHTDPKYPYTTLISQQQELDKLAKESETKSTTISLLRNKIEELEKLNPPNQLLQDQLQQKQQQIENLRSQLETKPIQELDNSLFARHQNLKDWFTQYQKNKQLDTELLENIDEASNELINQDNQISQLRGQITKLKLTNQSLQKDLTLAQRLAESRKVPYYSPEDKGTYLKYGLYSLIAVAFLLWFLPPEKQ